MRLALQKGCFLFVEFNLWHLFKHLDFVQILVVCKSSFFYRMSYSASFNSWVKPELFRVYLLSLSEGRFWRVQQDSSNWAMSYSLVLRLNALNDLFVVMRLFRGLCALYQTLSSFRIKIFACLLIHFFYGKTDFPIITYLGDFNPNLIPSLVASVLGSLKALSLL